LSVWQPSLKDSIYSSFVAYASLLPSGSDSNSPCFVGSLLFTNGLEVAFPEIRPSVKGVLRDPPP
jgi:hypothetical protein